LSPASAPYPPLIQEKDSKISLIDSTITTATTTTQAKMVKFVESEGEWMELMEQSKEKLVVVDFTASW
jgi:thiol:disulfide interchange protein